MRLIFFLCLLFYSIAGSAQNNGLSDDAVIQNYGKSSAKKVNYNFIKTDVINIDSGSLLVKVKNENIILFKKQFQQFIQRQLFANWFIITKTLLIQNNALAENYFDANNNWKFSPALFLIKDKLPHFKEFTFLAEVSDSAAFRRYVTTSGDNQATIVFTHNKKLFSVKTNLQFVLNNLINKSFVLSLSLRTNAPKEETVLTDYDNSVNAINLFFAKYPSINGAGLTASVKENLFDTNDIDFKERYLTTPLGSATVTTHATIMATIIGGGGNSFYTAKGIAPASRIASSDFADLLPDNNSVYRQYGISVQNHSYGTSIENFYGSDAAAFDQSAIENPTLLYIFSAGNSGNITSEEDGPYVKLLGFANLTGSFKQAKNIITVGAADSFYHVPLLSSKGPAYDGRIKPELVAYGNDGTSGAAAITSGTALAVQNAYATLHNDSLPQNALVKAILINSADDVGNAGPDFYSGYGNVNTFRAVSDMFSGNYFSDTISQSETKNFSIHVPANIKNIKVTLVWNDAPAQTGAFTSLVNDLDLELENNINHALYLPWVLNSAADTAALLALPVRKRDSLNVAEQITVDDPATGDYTVHIKGYNIAANPQAFYVVYQMDTANNFIFISPSANDNFSPDNKNTFRWSSTYTPAAGKLEYSTDKGLNWKTISTNIDLSQKYYSWPAPDTFTAALARMTINNHQYVSDTFTISKQLYVQVGFSCGDSALIYWNKAPGISGYQIYRLGAKYLEPFAVLNDTNLVVHNSADFAPYIAVAPVISNNYTGVKSYTYNYTTQGAGCFISNFLADITSTNSAHLQLFLGTLLHVNSVQLQQQTISGWQTITTLQPVTNTYLSYEYDSLQNGINNFRALVTLTGGNTVLSDIASIDYFKNNQFILFPNPASRSYGFTVLSQNIDANNLLLLYDATGRKIMQRPMKNATEKIPLQALAKGVYFIVILNENQPVFKSKLIVE